MERTEFRREATRLLREVQYLENTESLNTAKQNNRSMQHRGCGGVLLCDLQDPQQSDAPEHREAQRGHGSSREDDHLQDSAQHHEEVKAVEQGHEVRSEAQRVHLDEHFNNEEHQQHTTGHVCSGKGRKDGTGNKVDIYIKKRMHLLTSDLVKK